MNEGAYVAGYCPMGCGHTLNVGEGGFITCGSLSCPRPDAVASLLQERETEHIVQLRHGDFTILHPLRERLDELLNCRVHEYIADHERAPFEPGRYRVQKVQTGSGWIWDRIPERKDDSDGQIARDAIGGDPHA